MRVNTRLRMTSTFLFGVLMLRKVMMWANRSAFYYTLDREAGEFLPSPAFDALGE